MAVETSELMRLGSDYLTRLRESLSVDAIWLFGSRVRGDFREDSDLDIAVVSPEFDQNYMTAYRKANLALWRFDSPCDIEIHAFGRARFDGKDEMAEEIRKHGIMIQ
ncbi:MAG: nucleotidyltransferase domain-containing protein [Bacilli bacterium]